MNFNKNGFRIHRFDPLETTFVLFLTALLLGFLVICFLIFFGSVDKGEKQTASETTVEQGRIRVVETPVEVKKEEFVKEKVDPRVFDAGTIEPGVYVLFGEGVQRLFVVTETICLDCLQGAALVVHLEDIVSEDEQETLRKLKEFQKKQKK